MTQAVKMPKDKDETKYPNWFDDHVVVIGPHAKKIKAALKQKLANKETNHDAGRKNDQ